MLDYFEKEVVRVSLKTKGTSVDSNGNQYEGNIAYEGIFMGHDKDFIYLGAKINERDYILGYAFRKEEVVFVSLASVHENEDAPADSSKPPTGVLN